MSAWSTISTLARITSTLSPARSASRSSDKSNWDRATAGLLLHDLWTDHTEVHAVAHLNGGPQDLHHPKGHGPPPNCSVGEGFRPWIPREELAEFGFPPSRCRPAHLQLASPRLCPSRTYCSLATQ